MDNKESQMSLKNSREENQWERLLARLKKQPCSTFEARAELGISSPQTPIHQLRHNHGHNIQKTWIMVPNSYGGVHRIAQYFLRPGIYTKGDKGNDNK
jgi:hypothetical protein